MVCVILVRQMISYSANEGRVINSEQLDTRLDYFDSVPGLVHSAGTFDKYSCLNDKFCLNKITQIVKSYDHIHVQVNFIIL